MTRRLVKHQNTKIGARIRFQSIGTGLRAFSISRKKEVKNKKMEKNDYGYFYGEQSQLFSFFRIPKKLITDENCRKLSLAAKFLYGVLLDRMDLSSRNGWVDEQNRVYIIFTLEEINASLWYS